MALGNITTQYVLRPGTPVTAALYAPGMEDGIIHWNSDTVLTNPVPVELQEVALMYLTETSPTDWVINMPYVGTGLPIPEGYYVVLPATGPKFVMSPADFHAKYIQYDGGGDGGGAA